MTKERQDLGYIIGITEKLDRGGKQLMCEHSQASWDTRQQLGRIHHVRAVDDFSVLCSSSRSGDRPQEYMAGFLMFF